MSGAASSGAVPQVSPLETVGLLGSGAFLLDVREDDEWAAGHAAEAVHVPMGLVTDRLDEVPKTATVVCVCRAGARSATVAGALIGAGYDARNLDGGMQAWQAAGLPVVTDGGGPGTVA